MITCDIEERKDNRALIEAYAEKIRKAGENEKENENKEDE